MLTFVLNANLQLLPTASLPEERCTPRTVPAVLSCTGISSCSYAVTQLGKGSFHKPCSRGSLVVIGCMLAGSSCNMFGNRLVMLSVELCLLFPRSATGLFQCRFLLLIQCLNMRFPNFPFGSYLQIRSKYPWAQNPYCCAPSKVMVHSMPLQRATGPPSSTARTRSSCTRI